MSAEGLVALAAHGVAHCPSLSELWLQGKTSCFLPIRQACVCVCVCVHVCTCMQVWCSVLVQDVGGGKQIHHLLFCVVVCLVVLYMMTCVYACVRAHGRGGKCR